MNYEKAYNEMVQRARELHKGGNALTKLQMEIVCPELAESEDERIRKEILDFIKLCLSRTDFGSKSVALRKEDAEMFEKWIAYLEKQKINTEGDFARGYDCGYEACLNSHGAEWLEKQKEQKSEQSEMEKEYVRTLHSLISDFLRGKCGMRGIDREYYQKIWDWLDNRHIEQKPAEWGEEDEKIRRNLMSLLSNMRGDRITEETYQKYYPWLKSLRPAWKPSEEQMDALLNAEGLVRANNYPENAKILASLYEQLKKL